MIVRHVHDFQSSRTKVGTRLSHLHNVCALRVGIVRCTCTYTRIKMRFFGTESILYTSTCGHNELNMLYLCKIRKVKFPRTCAICTHTIKTGVGLWRMHAHGPMSVRVMILLLSLFLDQLLDLRLEDKANAAMKLIFEECIFACIIFLGTSI